MKAIFTPIARTVVRQASNVASNHEFIKNLVQLKAEEAFQKHAAELCTNVTPGDLESMAQHNASIAALLKEMGKGFPSYEPNGGHRYLLSLSNQKLLELLEKPLPGHVAVLRRYPVFCNNFVRELKEMAQAAAKPS